MSPSMLGQIRTARFRVHATRLEIWPELGNFQAPRRAWNGRFQHGMTAILSPAFYDARFGGVGLSMKQVSLHSPLRDSRQDEWRISI